MPKLPDVPQLPSAPRIDERVSPAAAMAPAMGMAQLGSDLEREGARMTDHDLRHKNFVDRGRIADVKHSQSMAWEEHMAWRDSHPDTTTWHGDWSARVNKVQAAAPRDLLPDNQSRLDDLMGQWVERNDARVKGEAEATDISQANESLMNAYRRAGELFDYDEQHNLVDLMPISGREKEDLHLQTEHGRKKAEIAADVEAMMDFDPLFYQDSLEELEAHPNISEAGKARLKRQMERRFEQLELEALREASRRITDPAPGELPILNEEDLIDAIEPWVSDEMTEKMVKGWQASEKDMPTAQQAGLSKKVRELMSSWFKDRRAGTYDEKAYLDRREALEKELLPWRANKDFQKIVEPLYERTTPSALKQMEDNIKDGKLDPVVEKLVGEVSADYDDWAASRLGEIELRSRKAGHKKRFNNELPRLILENPDKTSFGDLMSIFNKEQANKATTERKLGSIKKELRKAKPDDVLVPGSLRSDFLKSEYETEPKEGESYKDYMERVKGAQGSTGATGPAGEWAWPGKSRYFSENELRSKGNKKALMDQSMLTRADYMREKFGGPIRITSGYRDPKHNASLPGAAKDSRHMHGDALDIDMAGMSSAQRTKLLNSALDAGFTGIGFYKNSPNMLHVDAGRKRTWGSPPSWAKAGMKRKGY